MLQLNIIKENPKGVTELLRIKNFDAEALVEEIMELDHRRRETQKKMDDGLAEANILAKEIGILFKSGKGDEAGALKEKSAVLKNETQSLGIILEETKSALDEKMVLLPNLPHPSVPAGNSEEDNEVLVASEFEINLHDDAVPHWELAKKYDIIDFDLGAKVTGAGFPFYKSKGARLQRALINFFLDEALEAGYIEYQPPLFVNEDSAYGTGNLPDKDGQMYHIGEDNLYAIPTAEIPITNIYRDVILGQDALPIKNVAYSSCFRREAGSYGKDVRGLNRLHQFDKVEIVQICHPERSYDTLEEMRIYVASLLEKLELPYRILKLCGGDISFTSSLTYDFEVFSAAQKRWLEVSSVSNFEAFQSNRMKLRFRDENNKTRLAHTLNGSALALPRIVAALLENNQLETGINIPKALRAYTGFDLIS
ncbi:MAG: serine--tRNA ligase [Bacteroidales bacterium]|nr:serine--tRNA ligase [Bacteroidales bacterium]